jgi:DNA ligase D-like protein (predicted ligase)
MKEYSPMLARDAEAPFTSPDWIFEVKWDGVRAISYNRGKPSIKSRNGNELIDKFPELEELKTLTQHTVLDGEIIIITEGRTQFQKLLQRLQANSDKTIQQLARTHPATYIVFDLLEKDGENLTTKPLIWRKKILEDSVKDGEYVIKADYVEEKGEDYYNAALSQGLEGVVAKRKDSRYHQGRSKAWLKIKRVKTCDCVILGYTERKGSRTRTFGSLLLGLYKDEGIVYIGRAGTGFTENDLTSLKQMFKEIESKEATNANAEIPTRARWIEPLLVCQIGYHSVTKGGRLRMARYMGLRRDKEPRECTTEQLQL